MIWNYLKIIKRNLFKNSFISFINIFGLAIGIAASLLVFMHVTHEFSYDGFHKNIDHIYVLKGDMNYGGSTMQANAMSAAFGTALKNDIPEVKEVVRYFYPEKYTVKTEKGEIYYEKNFRFTDPQILELFSFKLKYGDKKTALSRPNSVILTEATAQKYFADKNPIGEILYLNKDFAFEVTGVIENVPSNSSINFDFLASLSSFSNLGEDKRQLIDNELIGLGSFQTFLYIPELKNVEFINEAIAGMIAHRDLKLDDLTFYIKPFKNLYLNERPTATKYLIAFLCTGLVILLLAIMNYTNLVTAQATTRSKETGIRKVIGARRSTLIFQFLFESVVTNTISFIIGLLLLHFTLTGLISNLNLKFDSSFAFNPQFLIVIAALFLLCLLLGSIYPAIVLSKFNTINILKGENTKRATGNTIRKYMTVFQFAASTVLICFSLIIQFQVDFLKEQNTGLSKDQILVVDLHPEIGNKYQTLKNAVSKLNGINSVGTATETLYKEDPWIIYSHSPISNKEIQVNFIQVDEDFFSTLDMEWAIPPNQELHQADVVVNENTMESMQIPDSLINSNFTFLSKKNRLSGVLKDFNYASLQYNIKPLALIITKDISASLLKNGPKMYLKIDKQAKISDVLAQVETTCKEFVPDYPFEYNFLDEAFNNLYKDEVQTARMFQFFTVIAIVIAALGLLGLASFAANRRTKEIGIRKVVGASVFNIFYLLSKEYFKLILISFVIAIPIANYFITEWLSGFAYRIEVKWWLYTLPTLLILTIALFAMGGRIIKAATVNPVDSLRDE
ncbi:ABC transporter permease [Chondrinema litorale]|uniref:ABC transporter permease n=1 Tax=Chondrinema litorale TaxID=2994555 RepID=UPI0025428E8A|nr:ABC transporter permease [Chondrinema litorale]UZR97580.1 ABC transporter permease [Chondrinema litorale]